MPFGSENTQSPKLSDQAHLLLQGLLKGRAIELHPFMATCTKDEAEREGLERQFWAVNGISVGGELYGIDAFKELLANDLVTVQGTLTQWVRESCTALNAGLAFAKSAASPFATAFALAAD